MKKKILSLAVAAGLSGVMAGAAHAAMHINDKGMGEVLVYPFYSVEGGNDTLVHVVNTTGQTKAVKVRFMEAYNSAEVLDFNLYLSPYDEWAATITLDADTGGAKLITADTSCTVPMLGTDNPPFNGHVDDKGRKHQPFTNNQLIEDGDLVLPSVDVSRTTQGYIEIFEMGQLDPKDGGLGQAAVHVANSDGVSVPQNCGAIQNAWLTAPGAWNQDANASGGTGVASEDMLTWGEDGIPGGLWGYGVLMNVADGTAVGYDAIAIDSFYSGTANLHYPPGDLNPSFTNASAVATIFDQGQAYDYAFDDGFDAVSALFMSLSINNDYIVDPGLSATTDWVITMPTKRHYVFPTASEPFYNPWNKTTRVACEKVGVEHWDREEAYVPPPPSYNFSPIRPGETGGTDPVICTEVSVLQFASDSAVHAKDIGRFFDPSYNEGWARLSFDPDDLNSSTGVADRVITGIQVVNGEPGATYDFHGLPVAGFAVIKYQNGDVGGVLANYAAGVKHKTETRIVPVQ